MSPRRSTANQGFDKSQSRWRSAAGHNPINRLCARGHARSIIVVPEGHNLVVGVMPDVGASQPWDPGPSAPITRDLLFVHSEIRFVGGDGAATAQHDARHPPDSGVAGDVK